MAQIIQFDFIYILNYWNNQSITAIAVVYSFSPRQCQFRWLDQDHN